MLKFLQEAGGVVQGRSVMLKVPLGWTSRAVSAGTGLYMGLIHAGIRGDFRCVEEFIGRVRELARGCA
jgi:hypothetical protein